MSFPIHSSIPSRPLPPTCISDYSLSNSHHTSPTCGRNPSVMKKRLWDSDIMTISTDSMNLKNRENTQKIHYSLAMLGGMAVGSILMCIVTMEFFMMSDRSTYVQDRVPETQRWILEVLREVIDSLDAAIIVTSLASFFCSTFQIFFALKMLKSQPTSSDLVLRYLSGNSFMRLVVYSFWFVSVLLFIAVLVISTLLSPNRGNVSKGVCVALGVAALLLCSMGAIKSIIFWTTTASYNHAKPGDYKNFSTLV